MHCVDEYTVLSRYYSLGGDSDMPGGLMLDYATLSSLLLLPVKKLYWRKLV